MDCAVDTLNTKRKQIKKHHLDWTEMGFWRHIYRLRQKIEKDAAARRACDAEQNPDFVILVQGKMVTPQGGM